MLQLLYAFNDLTDVISVSIIDRLVRARANKKQPTHTFRAKVSPAVHQQNCPHRPTRNLIPLHTYYKFSYLNSLAVGYSSVKSVQITNRNLGILFPTGSVNHFYASDYGGSADSINLILCIHITIYKTTATNVQLYIKPLNQIFSSI